MFLTLSIWRRMSSMVNCWDGEVALVSFGVDFDARIHFFGLNLCVIAEKKKFTRTTRQRSQTRTSRASPRARIESYLNHGGRLFLIPFELLNARARVRAFFELERIFPFSMEMMMSLPFREVDNFRFFCLFRSKICNHKKSDDQQQERTCTLRTHV